MNRFILLLALLGLVAKSQVINAQTHYGGIVNNIVYTRTSDNNCDDRMGGKSPDGSIEYNVFHRSGLPDSIMYYIFGTAYPLPSFPGFQFRGFATQITYLKNDADSIVFTFSYGSSHQEHNSQVPIGDKCRWYMVYDDYSGVARISTTTAGITLQESNSKPIQLFPNPTNGLLKIITNPKKAIVSDNLGRIAAAIILSAPDAEGFVTLDVSNLTAGYYSLILDDGAKKAIGKFIKY